MTNADLQRIETELRISLPADYRSLMLAYPFPPDSFTAECLLPNSANTLLELAGGSENLPPHSFIIGDDGGEETYFINVSRQSSPVYVFELETGKVKEKAPNLDAYVEECRRSDDEIRRDQAEMARKKWWQFWKG